MTENLGVADLHEESERVVVAAIEKHARGGVEALARGITEELRSAGLGDPPRRCDFNTQSEAPIRP